MSPMITKTMWPILTMIMITRAAYASFFDDDIVKSPSYTNEQIDDYISSQSGVCITMLSRCWFNEIHSADDGERSAREQLGVRSGSKRLQSAMMNKINILNKGWKGSHWGKECDPDGIGYSFLSAPNLGFTTSIVQLEFLATLKKVHEYDESSLDDDMKKGTRYIEFNDDEDDVPVYSENWWLIAGLIIVVAVLIAGAAAFCFC